MSPSSLEWNLETRQSVKASIPNQDLVRLRLEDEMKEKLVQLLKVQELELKD